MNVRTETTTELLPELATARLLVAEDDPGHAEAIRRAFERHGCGAGVVVVRTLAELRRSVDVTPPHLVLVDLNLPDGQAFEVLTSPSSDGPFPIVVMTSFGNEQIAVQAMKAGAIDYVVKSAESFAAMPRTAERALVQWAAMRGRQIAERRAQQLNRVYRLHSEINKAIVRIRDVHALLEEAARVAVEEGGFRAAWIGLVEPESQKVLFCRYAGLVPVEDEGPGPAGIALETGERSVCNDVRTDPRGQRWREMAERRRFLAWAATPLAVGGETVGALCLYSSEAEVFDESELALLDELAMDLSFAVEMARREAARREAELQVERLNASLEAKVQERTAALESANRELESFSYSVSHDLRAPLRAIDGFSQILVESLGGTADEETRGLLARIRGGAKRMGQLVDDLLRFSRLGRASMHREPLDLAQVAREVATELKAANPERQVEFVLAEPLPADADPSLAAVLLRNLLGNAWKFTAGRAMARVEVGVEVSEGERVYFVADNGAGFESSYAKALFQPFQRLHRSDEFEGTGIGLAIVRRIVERHGGRVWIEGAVDRGATARFTLPAAQPGSAGSEPR